MSIFSNSIIIKGGWVMAPIILGSIVAFAVAVERGRLFWKTRFDQQKFIDEVFSLVKTNQLSGALQMCKDTFHPIARIFQAALEKWEGDASEIERTMEHEGTREIVKLEKNMNILLIVVGVEPLLGFLGTILGLIRAFMTWEQYAESVTVNQLAAGIYEAMITTAAGLLIAIPFYVLYNYFIARINTISKDLNFYGEELLNIHRKASKA